MMVHILDANVLIDANRDYYPIARVPEFWDWLQFHGTEGNVTVPVEVYEEILAGRPDDLVEWLRRNDVKDALLLREEADPVLVARAVSEGYASDLTDEDVEKIGRDPFLVSYGLVDLNQRTVVTMEASRPSKTRANRKLPDVCTHFGIPTSNTFALTKQLGFSTSWST